MDTKRRYDTSRGEAMVRALHEYWIEEPIDLITPYIHPDAEMRLLVSYGELVRGREGVARAMHEGRAAATWRAEVDRVEWLDSETALTSGYARYPLQGGGFGEGKVFWLDRLRDGMIWHVRVFRSEDEARQAYGDAAGDLVLRDAP
jgi:hypothetical protein